MDFFDNATPGPALCPLPFEIAVMCLVEAEQYVMHQHLLELIPPALQLVFLELLRSGTDMRGCFEELDAFLAWQNRMLPFLLEQELVLPSASHQVSLYLLDKTHPSI